MGKRPTKRTAKKRKTSRSRRKQGGRVNREYVEAILVAVAIALVIRTFVIQAFRIPSASMQDTLLVGDFLLADKLTYGPKIPFTDVRLPGFTDPSAGDVLIFEYPPDPDRDFIKRCVAVAGQKVQVIDKVLFVDGKRSVDPPFSKYLDPRIFPKKSPNSRRDNFGPVVVPEGHIFVMGDNRDNSEDSRYWGTLPTTHIKARARVMYWSWAPDEKAPEWTGITSIPRIFFYNLFKFPGRVRWTRIGRLIK